MRLYAYHDAHFADLAERFLDSMRDPFEVHMRGAPVAVRGARAGGIDNLIVKTGYIAAVIEENRGKCVVFSDVDIQFFGPVMPVVDAALEGQDIVFQREWSERGVNTGFMAIRCNSATIGFWGEVFQRLRELQPSQQGRSDTITEQHLVNCMLDGEEIELARARFPSRIWSWSQGGFRPDIRLHHANCVRTKADKLRQMDVVASWVAAGHSA